jgi:uncharacterized membrane protein
MNSSEHRRLMDEIGLWTKEGLITEEQALAIRARYLEPATKRWSVIITSVFGSLLVGLGIILLLAYNWTDLSRAARAGIAYLPLVAALGLCGWIVFTGKTGTGLREGAGAFLALAVGASLALVAQTYQLGGTFRALTLAWMLLILPSVYVLDAVMPALIYLFGITGWAIGQRCYDDNPWAFWALLAGIVPYLVWCQIRNRDSLRGVWVLWGVVISAAAGVATGMHAHEPVLWFSLYAAFFTVCLLAGELWGARELTLWGRPLTLLGGAGLGVMVFLYSFIWFWEEMDRNYRYYWGYQEKAVAVDAGLVAFFTVLAVVLLVLAFRRLRNWPLRLAAAFPVVAAVLVALNTGLAGKELIPAIVMNVYAFGLGGLIVSDAVRESKLGQMNLGLLLLAALITARFFDADMSILGRGIAFIVLGLAFLAANGLMIRRRRVS